MKNPLEFASAHLEGKVAYGATQNFMGLLLNPFSLQTKPYPTRQTCCDLGRSRQGVPIPRCSLDFYGSLETPTQPWLLGATSMSVQFWSLGLGLQSSSTYTKQRRTNLAYQATTAVVQKVVAGWWHLWAEKCVVKPLPQTLLVAQAWTGVTGSKVHTIHIVNDIRYFGRK